MNKKRILLIADVRNWGGWVRGEYIIKHLSDEFDITLVDDNEFKNIEFISNESLFIQENFDKFKNQISTDKTYFDVNEFKKYIHSTKNNKDFDLYYFLFHTMLIKKSVKRLLNKGKKVATIVTGYPTIKPCFIKGAGNDNFIQLSKKCKAIFSNNIISLNDLNKVKPLEMPTYYCPRGVDENIFYPTESNRDGKFTVAYVGKPVPEKGLEQFIKPACEKTGTRLIINDRNYINALSPDKMREFYNMADCLIVASTIDGTPNPALEAAACGRPIISNPIGNMPELIKDGINGFLIKDRNIDKYANRIIKLKNNKEKCIKMGKEARKTILKDWTWKKVLKNERKAFREILSGRL